MQIIFNNQTVTVKISGRDPVDMFVDAAWWEDGREMTDVECEDLTNHCHKTGIFFTEAHERLLEWDE